MNLFLNRIGVDNNKKESFLPRQKNDSAMGRSMVEMLGTLAIIGVLSIGGITGYNYAFEKYWANETMDELNHRSVVYAAHLENESLGAGETISNGEYGNKTALGYTVKAVVSEYDGEFNIIIDDIPSKVCVQILKNYPTPVEILANGSKYDDVTQNTTICGTESADMVFAFKQNLSNRWEEAEMTPSVPEVTEEPLTCGELTCTSGNDTWCCETPDGPPSPDTELSCGSAKNICCFGGVCCDLNSNNLINYITEIYCCPKGVNTIAWEPGTTNRMCCDVDSGTKTLVTDESTSWVYCCPAGSTAIVDGTCI